MKKRFSFICLLVLVLPAFINAQTYRVFNTDNSGLPYNSVYSIDFDHDGNVWFGGQKDAATGIANVSKLAPDLETWKVYEQAELALPEDRVFYMAVDDLNNIWMCTHYGVSVLRADGTAELVDFTNDLYTRTVQTDPGGSVYISIRMDDRAESRIWVSADQGANWNPWSLADIGMSQSLDDARPEIYDLSLDSKGQMWICTWYGVTYRKTDGTWKSFSELEGSYTFALTIDKNDHVWVPINGQKDLLEILPDESIIVHDSTKIEPLKYEINDLEADANGHIWCALSGGGLLEIMPDGSFQQYTVASTGGALPEDVLIELELHNNEVWIVTETMGVVQITDLIQPPAVGLNFQVFDSENSRLPYNSVYCIDFDQDGNIWFGGQKDAATGIANVSNLAPDLETWKVYEQVELALPEDRVFYMAVDDLNNIWMCTHYGVSVLRADGTAELVEFTNDLYTRTVQTDPSGNVYISIRMDDRAESRIWVSADHGTNWNPWSLTDIGISLSPGDARPEIYDLSLDSKGQMWICTWYGVTYRKADGTWKSFSELEGSYTFALTIDKNDHVWVPISEQKDLLEILPDESIIVHDSTKIEPLKYEVNDLEADANGHIWCALSGGGLLEIMPAGSFQQYTVASTGGALPEDVLIELELHNGEMWLATETKGVVRVAGLPTAIEAPAFENTRPVDFQLFANYPNPFNPDTHIRFNLNRDENIELSVYNLRGELIRVINAGHFTAGSHTAHWDGRDQNGQLLASGVYVYRLGTEQGTLSKKMMFIK